MGTKEAWENGTIKGKDSYRSKEIWVGPTPRQASAKIYTFQLFINLFMVAIHVMGHVNNRFSIVFINLNRARMINGSEITNSNTT